MGNQSSAYEPKTDREWIIILAGQLERLGDAITRLDATLKNIEDNRLVRIEERLHAIERWHQQDKGMWRALTAMATVISIAAAIKAFVF